MGIKRQCQSEQNRGKGYCRDIPVEGATQSWKEVTKCMQTRKVLDKKEMIKPSIVQSL